MTFQCPGCGQEIKTYSRRLNYPTPFDMTINGDCHKCNKPVEAIVDVSGNYDNQIVVGTFHTWVSKWARDFHEQMIRSRSKIPIKFF